jgi:hypothetical protein
VFNAGRCQRQSNQKANYQRQASYFGEFVQIWYLERNWQFHRFSGEENCQAQEARKQECSQARTGK